METITNTIPLTAWEQIVVVCLFAVIFTGLVIYLLGWFSKQQTNWQNFTRERDNFWQTWLEKANCNTTDAMKTVMESLQAVNKSILANTSIVQNVVEQLEKHDDKVNISVENAVQSIKDTFISSNGTISPDRRKK